MLRGALSGAVTAGLVKEVQGSALASAGVDQAGNVSIYALRAMSISGQATLQGALQSLLGGKFKDGFPSGLTQGLAQEISSALNRKIAAMGSTLSPTEASALRLLSQATGSAVRALGNPNDPGSAFASDFLRSLVLDAAPAAGQPSEGSSASASFEEQQAQLQARLIQQGMSPQQAEQLAATHYDEVREFQDVFLNAQPQPVVLADASGWSPQVRSARETIDGIEERISRCAFQ